MWVFTTEVYKPIEVEQKRLYGNEFYQQRDDIYDLVGLLNTGNFRYVFAFHVLNLSTQTPLRKVNRYI